MGLYRLKTYNFKSRNCEEISDFDIPLAIKEYLQNTVGQILKALHVREWRNWDREELIEDTEANIKKRKQVKERLMKNDACLFAGDQGKAIAKSASCQPQYVLQTVIPREQISHDRRRNHNLRAVVIFWCIGGKVGVKALTVYNNYLDKETELSHFVHDGSSTSREDQYAVGRKGKGFSLSTTFLAQECQSFIEECNRTTQLQGSSPRKIFWNLLGMNEKPVGIGFNVGGRMCRGAFSKGHHPVLKVKFEDLRALSVEQFKRENPLLKNKAQSDDEESDDDEAEQPDDLAFEKKLITTYKKRSLQNLALKNQITLNPTSPNHEQPLVLEDDVCIHVIGLPASLTAEEAFSDIHGIFEQPKSWTIQLPGSKATHMEIFETKQKKALFYLRDQLVPIGSLLTRLSINYPGELHLSSDRTEVSCRGPLHAQYQRDFGRALDIEICSFPELAVLILESLLVDKTPTYKIEPHSQGHGEQYRVAFTEACRLVFPEKFSEAGETKVYPFAIRTEDQTLIREVRFIPIPLSDSKMTILEMAGAYTNIRQYTEKLLLQATELPATQLVGLDCLNRCLHSLVPELEHDMSVRQYPHSVPQVLYRGNRFVLAHPDALQSGGCQECPAEGCICWVGPALLASMKQYDRHMARSRIFQIYDKERGLKDTRAPEHLNVDLRDVGSKNRNIKGEYTHFDDIDTNRSAGDGFEGLFDSNSSIRSTIASTPTRKASFTIHASSTRANSCRLSSHSPSEHQALQIVLSKAPVTHSMSLFPTNLRKTRVKTYR